MTRPTKSGCAHRRTGNTAPEEAGLWTPSAACVEGARAVGEEQAEGDHTLEGRKGLATVNSGGI